MDGGMGLLWALLIMIVVGGVIGWLASILVGGSGLGLAGDVVVGIVGSVVAGWVANAFGVSYAGVTGAIIASVLGAAVVLLAIRLVKRA